MNQSESNVKRRRRREKSKTFTTDLVGKMKCTIGLKGKINCKVTKERKKTIAYNSQLKFSWTNCSNFVFFVFFSIETQVTLVNK